jgi:hypothetical protein
METIERNEFLSLKLKNKTIRINEGKTIIYSEGFRYEENEEGNYVKTKIEYKHNKVNIHRSESKMFKSYYDKK